MPWDVSIAQGVWGWAWLILAVAMFLFFFGLVVTMFFRLLLTRPAQFDASEPEPVSERRRTGEIDQETDPWLDQEHDRK